jgi:hypothetical protein
MEEFKLPLTGKYGDGKFVYLSEEDYETFKDKSICMSANGYPMIYFNKALHYLHRLVANPPAGDSRVVDHVDGDKLNCRRENLNLCDYSKNLSNKGKVVLTRDTTSVYVGVCKSGNKWSAYIKKDGVSHRLGLFDTQEEAAFAYNMKALELHKTYATLNIVNGRVLP